jgi:hypothetical protein
MTFPISTQFVYVCYAVRLCLIWLEVFSISYRYVFLFCIHLVLTLILLHVAVSGVYCCFVSEKSSVQIWPGGWLTCLRFFVVLPSPIQANIRIIPWIRTRQLSSISLPVYFSSAILSFSIIGLQFGVLTAPLNKQINGQIYFNCIM